MYFGLFEPERIPGIHSLHNNAICIQWSFIPQVHGECEVCFETNLVGMPSCNIKWL